MHAPPDHLELPERTRVIWEAFLKSGLAARCERVPARELTRKEALLCHTAEHRDALEALARAAKAGEAERFKGAPYLAPMRRLDETLAARKPRLTWKPAEGVAPAPLAAE